MKFSPYLLLSSVLLSSTITAEQWIDSDSTHLRAAIEQLVSEGVINRPVNRYPLNWQGIAQDIHRLDESALSDNALFALIHVRYALNVAKRSGHSGLKLTSDSHPENPKGFGDKANAKASLQGYSVLMGDNVTAKVAIKYQHDALSGKEITYDDSYLAVLLGNWVLSAEQVSHWWGPGNETALLMSQNASPMPGIRLSRHNSDYYGPQFLSFIGPWHFTAFLGKNKSPGNDKLDNSFWAARFSFMPLKGLELALNQSAQFNGANNDHGWNDLINVVTAKNKLNSDGINEYNQLTSLDAKYSTRLFQQNIAVYGEYAGRKATSLLPEETKFTLGGEHFFGNSTYLVKSYIEYSDLDSGCDITQTSLPCHQSHPLYDQSYQHLDQSISAAPDAATKSWTVASLYQQTNGIAAGFKVKQYRYQASSDYTKRTQIALNYQQGVFDGLFKVDISYWLNEGNKDIADNDVTLGGSWEYRF